MNWNHYRDTLLSGKTVQFRPKGRSMEPKIKSGQLITVEPISDLDSLQIDDIVFCKVSGAFYVHLIKNKKFSDKHYFLIGNNKHRINGWTTKIFGKVIDIQD